MNELDILKKHWQTAEKNLPKFSYNELYQMLHKKSSSTVKWILIISIIEFAIWGLLYFVIPEGSQNLYDKVGLNSLMLISTVISLAVFVLFIFLFYHNYSKIKVTDSVKQLMNSILRTRRTVYFFIIWNIASTLIAFVYVSFYLNQNKAKLTEYIIEQNPEFSMEHSESFINVFFIGYALAAFTIIGIMLLLYRIVYVRLLKRLNHNYKQLQSIESDFEQGV